MARKPIVGSDSGTWGDLLNEFLDVEHETGGELKIRTDGTLDDIPVGGDLTGTVSNAQIAAGAVGGTEVAAAIKDPVAGTAGLRTLGTGTQQAAAGNDSRLSDSRTPLAHTASHAPTGTDAINYNLVNLTGTLAARPAAAAANTGLYYFASDDNGGTMHRSNGTIWTKAAAGVAEVPGIELAYAELSTTFSGTSTTGADVTGLSISFNAPARPFYVEAYFPIVQLTTANSLLVIFLFDEGNLDLQRGDWSTHATPANAAGSIMVRRRFSMPGGTAKTFRIRYAVTAGTGSIYAANTSPSFYRPYITAISV